MYNGILKKIITDNNYNFIHLKSIDSTMLYTKKYIENFDKNCIVLSDSQTNGKGRRGSIWHSPKGNIYCSISFKNIFKKKNFFLFNILICVSIKKTLEKFKVNDIGFKWPNDIFYKDKKFSGMISEIFNYNNSKEYVIIGFGVNVSSSPDIKKYPTTYIKSFCKDITKEVFLYEFFKLFFFNINNINLNKNRNIINYFKKFLMFKNKEIKILLDNKYIHKGIFKDIDIDGSLILDTDGKILNVYNGSIEL